MSPVARLRSATVLVGIGLFVAALGLYASTLAPTLTWGWDDLGVDGGELLAAANTFGVPHPPGYPTYTLLLKLFATIVPVGDFAFRGNLMSAVFAAASVVAVYAVALRFCLFLTKPETAVPDDMRPEAPRWLAVVAASLGASVFATSPLFWSQAVITEVYTLNALLVGALLLIATHVALPLSHEETSKFTGRSVKAGLALFGLLLGLGLGNHLTLLAVAVPLLYWMGSRIGWRTLVSQSLIGPFLAGLSVYPESTEGRPWGQPLKKPAGAPLNLG